MSSAEAAPRSWGDHHGDLLDRVDSYEVIRCERCAFSHLIPIPDEAELTKIYRTDYYSVDKPLYLERHREDLDWWNLVYDERYDSFEELLDAGRRRILDIGSGPGFFLERGVKRGWEPLGVEPSQQAAEHTRGLGVEVIEAFLDERLASTLGSFDVVHMSEVLEHIPNPGEMLELASGLLSPGGLVCVSVPNDYNAFQGALQRVSGFEPWWVAPPFHINYFDPGSLARLFGAAGLEVVLSEGTFPIDMFLLMGDNYVGDDEMGRSCHGKRKAFELALEAAGLSQVKRALYRSMLELGIGREILMIGRKP